MDPDQIQQQDPEKAQTAHLERKRTVEEDDDRAPEARGRNADQLEKDYWRSYRFIGTLAALGLGFAAATGGFALIAPLLSQINEELGPSPNITWVGLGNVLGQSVFFLLVGRLSDVFGRRWFFIVGSLIGLIGSIVGATAQSVNTLIGSEVLIGVASAFQISFFWVISEIVPEKWRYVANTYVYFCSIPVNPLGPKVAYSLQRTSAGWRGGYYICIGLNAASALCWYLFYHPPTFRMLHRRKMVKDLLLSFDWIGLVLYIGSATILVMGLNWGGQLYPWDDPHVIGTVVVGGIFLFVVFPGYEYLIQKRGHEPFLPLKLFKNLKYQACTWITAIGAAVYYGFSLIWPQAVQTLYPGLSYDRLGTLVGLAPLSFCFGQQVGGIISTFVGPRIGIILPMWASGVLLAACVANPLNLNLTMGLMVTGILCSGWSEANALTTVTFTARPEDLGVAGGLSGSLRAFGSVVASAIYTSTLSNRLADTIPQYVPPAAEQAGLPSSSVPALLLGLSGDGPLTSEAVPGLNTAINGTVGTAYRYANSEAYKTVFWVSFAFSGCGMILCWFITPNDKSTAQFVAGHLHERKDEKALEQWQGKDVPQIE